MYNLEDKLGVTCMVEPMPQSRLKGDLDLNVEKDVKQMARIARLIPEKCCTFNPLKVNLKPLKIPFDKVKGVPVVTSRIITTTLEVASFDNFPLQLKIYQPKSSNTQKPVVMYIHGGGFIAGSIEVVESYCKMISYLCDIVVVNLSYRLAPQYPYPTAYKDCFAQASFIKNNIENYGGNPKQLFVAGDSAGGNLTIYLARMIKEICGLILLYPVVDVACITPYRFDLYTTNEKNAKDLKAIFHLCHMNHGFIQKMATVMQVDPFDVNVSPILLEEGLQPMLIMVGEHDFLMLQVLNFAKHMQALKTEVDVVYFLGLTHGFGDFLGKIPQTTTSILHIKKFISKHLKL